MNEVFRKGMYVLAGLTLVFGLCFHLSSLVSEKSLGRHDPWQNASFGYNLYYHGTLSVSENHRAPSMHRDMLPGVFLAALIAVDPHFSKTTKYESLNKGVLAKRLKMINVFWAGTAYLLILGICYLLTTSYLMGWIAVILSHFLFYTGPRYIDTLYTEVPASTFLLLSSLCLILFFRNPKPKFAFAAGISLGFLALTKAAFLFIGAVALIVFFVFWKLLNKKTTWKKTFTEFFLIPVLFFGLCGTWMMRNYIHFRVFNLSGKGSNVLWARAHLNQNITLDEMFGSFIVDAPKAIKQMAQNFYIVKDNDFKLGGRWQRLYRDISKENDREAIKNKEPERAISLHRAGQAARRKLVSQSVSPSKESIKIILHNPLQHLLMTIVLAYRGLWSFSERYFTYWAPILNLLSFGAFIWVSIWAFTKKSLDLMGFVLLPLGMFSFYSLLTHFLSRYSAPIIPHFIISLCLVAYYIIQYFAKKRILVRS